MKRVVITKPREIRIEDTSRPERSADEALLKVRYVGICGSDVNTYRGSNPLATYPIVPGHELCCEVLESDEGFSPGDAVVVEPLMPCGGCYPCRLGRYNCCENLKVLGVHQDGGMAEEIALPLNRLYRLPDDTEQSLGPLVETLSIGYHACNRARIQSGDDVLVIGAGPIGLGAALIAKEKGARVGVVDRLDARLRLSLELGIDFRFQAKEDTETEVIEHFDRRPNVVIEAVGSPRTLELAIEVVSPAGRVVFVGWTSDPPQWRPDLFLKKELDFMGSRNSHDIFPEAIDFFQRNQGPLRRLVTRQYSMTDIEEAMTLMDAHPDQVMKIVVHW
jgi:threonine dehydrogenase-like Zn-dependent dehydrogenase